jgi:transposase
MHKVDHPADVANVSEYMIARIQMADNVLGIDVSKRKFDVAMRRVDGTGRSRAFANSEAGFGQLGEWLAKLGAGQVHACLESTGTYGLALAEYLHREGYVVSVVNPACIKAFAESALSRAKTDRVDAKLIARFCQAMHPQLWQPLAPPVSQLQGLVRRVEALQQMVGQERNRLEAPGISEGVRASLERMVELLERELEQVRTQIADHIDRHPELKQRRDLLCSIPGLGEVTAARLLSEMSGIEFGRARQVAAYAGLVPSPRESGTSVRGRGRLSKRGNPRLRQALYWPAIVAMRYNPILHAFAQRLLAAGKPKMVVIAAVMRKLLHLAFGVLKHGRPFDPNYHPAHA